jgi:hypothetical protein
MYARLNRFIDMDPDAITAALAWLQAEGFARVLSAPGFVTIFFGVNLSEGKGVGITFWDSDAAMRISEKIEAPVREEALRLACADRSKGLSDTYEVMYTDARPIGADDVLGHLVRWEGLEPAAMRDALEYFLDHELLRLQELPGYRGMFLGANPHLGNTAAVSLWEGQDMQELAEVERGATERVEARVGGPLRPIIIDTYQVVAVPELPVTVQHA